MAHVTPAAHLTWALLTLMLGIFLVYHLWSYDRFKCVRWSTHSGAFKRIMTYSYLISIPLLIVYTIGFTVIKYQYGWIALPVYGILPTPYELWSPQARSAILPLYLCFSFAWGLEMVTHLEELCFWIFLVNCGSRQQDWFRTLYFKTWAVGSCIAMVYMPLVTIFTRSDVYRCEAYTFLAGSLGSLSLTIWFLPVLWTFPTFLESLKQMDVEKNTLVRLTKFHELNCIRIVFRLLFTVPLLTLAIDGVRPHQHINDKMFPTDLLAMIAAIGVVISSGITLVVFFPRSVQCEMERSDFKHSLSRSHSHGYSNPCRQERAGPSCTSRMESTATHDIMHIEPALPTRSASNHVHGQGGVRDMSPQGPPSYDRLAWEDGQIVTQATGTGELELDRPDLGVREGKQAKRHEVKREEDVKSAEGKLVLLPNRRTHEGDVEMGGIMRWSRALARRDQTSRRRVGVNYLVHNWRSPIDLESFPNP